MGFLLPSMKSTAIKKKIAKHTNRQKTQFEKTEQTLEPDSDTYCIKTINMLKTLTDKVHSIKE